MNSIIVIAFNIVEILSSYAGAEERLIGSSTVILFNLRSSEVEF
jgi:hypothetical protein